ncbi:GNAT family N-acetyltransferase [Alkalihalobacillus macyae]|uniref:GNAT family N-acetyltransferase n=1 Tax=Guptibacillus hwajinpoensis TaxID=208199 RepID=UPI00273C84CB|nr:GNAT family N-acetyltransferase [Alkalihalobacillus macyae]MDP4549381.1 GNAT family N-acetyltransferase [Alkalihalobacillus macyae]
MNITIRNAKKDELHAIRRQRVEAYADHKQAIPEAHWGALRQAISSEADQQPGVELLVAEMDENIVGSVALFPANTDAYEGFVDEVNYPEIRVLAVAPSARGKGVATALLTECIHLARAQGFHEIGLHTGEFMKTAIALYERSGFKRLPQHDFEPANDGVIVKAFKRSIS